MNNKAWQNDLPEAFQTYLNGRRIDEVECVVPDLAGMSRGKAMPLAKFKPDHEIFLPQSIFYQTITGEDVDIDIENQWAEGDMVLKPDMSTARAAPWSNDATLQVIHDLYSRNGDAIEVSPRNVLKRIVANYNEQGWQPVIAPELEFYLTKPNLDPNEPIAPPIGRTGRQGSGRQSYSMVAVDEYGPVIDCIYDYAEHAGLMIDTIIQEDGAGQIEINLSHGDPIDLADQVFFFKRIIREAALDNGMFATFMAKPMRDEPGSAMHIHQSILDLKTGQNIFANADGSTSDALLHFVGGCQKYLMGGLPLIAPYVNSYRRFESDTNSSAPTNLAWGYDNRAGGLRVPISNPANFRVENRIIGVDVNPYLAIAASLACGYLGLMGKIAPDEPEVDELEVSNHIIPLTLNEALQLFEEASELRALLGETFCEMYSAVKHMELAQFQREISPWERQHLLLNV